MRVSRGDVVMVDWQFSDRTGVKTRPALVVQSDQLNTQLDDTILALITGSKRRRVGATTQLLVEVTTPDGQQSGLRFDSLVQCENLVTLDQSLILGQIGEFSGALMQQIDACLRAALGIS
jgi:mRNA interferase MazF